MTLMCLEFDRRDGEIRRRDGGGTGELRGWTGEGRGGDGEGRGVRKGNPPSANARGGPQLLVTRLVACDMLGKVPAPQPCQELALAESRRLDF